MVNMNHHEDPSIYALTHEGRVFYVGRTKINALNRWWQHRYRANSGHDSPLYVWMREVGVDAVDWKVLHALEPEENPRELEAYWIQKLVSEGVELVNTMGRDGRPDSWPAERLQTLGQSKRGLSTWIKGKTGEDAGWTEARRVVQSQKMIERAANRLASDPEMAARVEARKPKKHRSDPRIPNHGSRTEYEKYGCRCDACRAAGAAHNAEVRRRRAMRQ